MDAALFAKLFSDKHIFELNRMQYKYSPAEVKEFTDLLKQDFMQELPLQDFHGEPNDVSAKLGKNFNSRNEAAADGSGCRRCLWFTGYDRRNSCHLANREHSFHTPEYPQNTKRLCAA